jgi:hypothetical protein
MMYAQMSVNLRQRIPQEGSDNVVQTRIAFRIRM